MSSSDPLGWGRVDVRMWAFTCRGQRSGLDAPPTLSSLKQGLSLNQEPTHWPDCLTDEAQGSTCFLSPMLGLQSSTWLSCVAPEDQNSGPHACPQALHRLSHFPCLILKATFFFICPQLFHKMLERTTKTTSSFLPKPSFTFEYKTTDALHSKGEEWLVRFYDVFTLAAKELQWKSGATS